ncbi:RNA polymerase II C-terminal domain phosphatase-like protein 1 [Tanacetum coccineum]
MALVIDDRLKVWDERDQPLVHVVPAFASYYALQAQRVNEVAHEDDIKDILPPDMSNYSISDVFSFGPVLKIAMFDKNGDVQALIQYPDVQTAVVAISYARHTDLSIKIIGKRKATIVSRWAYMHHGNTSVQVEKSVSEGKVGLIASVASQTRESAAKEGINTSTTKTEKQAPELDVPLPRAIHAPAALQKKPLIRSNLNHKLDSWTLPWTQKVSC